MKIILIVFCAAALVAMPAGGWFGIWLADRLFDRRQKKG